MAATSLLQGLRMSDSDSQTLPDCRQGSVSVDHALPLLGALLTPRCCHHLQKRFPDKPFLPLACNSPGLHWLRLHVLVQEVQRGGNGSLHVF